MNSTQFLVLPALLIVTGFIFCFHGKGLFKPLLSFIGFLVGIFLAQRIFSGIIGNSFVLFAVIFSIGILFAFLTSFIYEIGVFTAGFVSVLLFLDCYGASFGVQEWNIIIKLLICAAGGIVAYFFQNIVISIVSAFLGSYLMVLNSCWILDFFKYHSKDQLATFSQYYDFFGKTVAENSVVLIIITILTILGIISQWKIIRKK